MDIYIKDMEMPDRCNNCFASHMVMPSGNTVCQISRIVSSKGNPKRPKACPLVELPPHGRLIDADALKYSIRTEIGQAGCQQIVTDFVCVMQKDIESAPTVIPAEEGERWLK